MAESNTISDELIDEFDGTIMILGRLFSSRHGEVRCEGQITMPQMLLLRVLEHEGALRMSDIASVMGTKLPAASALVDALVQLGYVERDHDAEDRRVTLACITDGGRAALVTAENERRDHMRRYMSVLSEDDVRTMTRINLKLIEAMTSERV